MSPVRTGPDVVINADDFGLSNEVNRAVVECFAYGCISSATIMANMPAIDEAADLVDREGLRGCVGVHLNLTEGVPLTDPIRRQPRFCDKAGLFHGRGPTIWRLFRDEERAIWSELSAQITKVRERGISPTHLDSHHHVHTQWPVVGIAIDLARHFGIRAIRPPRNCGPTPSPFKSSYKSIVGWRLRRSGLAKVRHFGSAPDAATIDEFAGPVEVMVHPKSETGDRIIDLTTGRDDLMAIAEHWRDVGHVVSYAQVGKTQ